MIDRRQFFLTITALLSELAFSKNPNERLLLRAIPSSGERIPVIGMGTSRTFDLKSGENFGQLAEVLESFFIGGGTVIDSSPMYGNAESTIGSLLSQLDFPHRYFAATKVWETGKEEGIEQMLLSKKRMNVKKLDLIAVHNLVDWKTHLSTLKKWKEEGKVRYIGITTSHGRYRSELIKIMQTEEIDFVQFSYNIEDRDAEFDLFPLARRRGIATMINRPFKRGGLFKITKDQSLPEVAKDLEVYSWAQFFLKFILSNPAVTNIIPATSKKYHMIDNMKANKGVIPTPIQRQEMLNAFMRIRNNF
tara:strand:+ start:21 stop:935 length:915 start_codon:yes stop_codon:yes gene_type:complete